VIEVEEEKDRDDNDDGCSEEKAAKKKPVKKQKKGKHVQCKYSKFHKKATILLSALMKG
jgi:hypothetical protein